MMKQTAVEFLVEQIKKDSNLRLRGFDIDGIGKQAKEIEKQQKGYSEEEVVGLLYRRSIYQNHFESDSEIRLWFEKFKKK